MDSVDLHELCMWIGRRLAAAASSTNTDPSSSSSSSTAQTGGISSLQEALAPSTLLSLLALIVPPVPGEPSLSALAASGCSWCGDVEALLHVYLAACKRFGIKCLFHPHAHPSLASMMDNEEGGGAGGASGSGGGDVIPILMNLLEIRALSEAKDNAAAAQALAAAAARQNRRRSDGGKDVTRSSMSSPLVAEVVRGMSVSEGAGGGGGFDRRSSSALSAMASPEAAAGAAASSSRASFAQASSTTSSSRHVRLTYAEHCSLYSGRVPPEMSRAGRERLWRWLLEYEPAALAHVDTHRAQVAAAARRVNEAKRAAGASGSPDDSLVLLHMLMSPSHGIVLVRRRLVRALVRAGIPPQVRGRMWIRLAGGGDSTGLVGGNHPSSSSSSAAASSSRAGNHHHYHAAQAPLLQAAPASELASQTGGAASALSSSSSSVPSSPAFHSSSSPLHQVAATIPALVADREGGGAGTSGEGGGDRTGAAGTADIPRVSIDTARLSLYDSLLLVNAAHIPPADLPCHLRPLADQAKAALSLLLSVQVEVASEGGGSSSPTPTTPAPPIPPAWTRGFSPASEASVTQVEKDLRRTMLHLPPIEPGRVRVREKEKGEGRWKDTAGSSEGDERIFGVADIYSARHALSSPCVHGEPCSCSPAPEKMCVCSSVVKEAGGKGGIGTGAGAAAGAPAAGKGQPPLSPLSPSVTASAVSSPNASSPLQTESGWTLCSAGTAPQFSSLSSSSSHHLDSSSVSPHTHPHPSASANTVTVSLGATRRVLLAFASYAPSIGYCQGLNWLAAHALRWLAEADAFALLTFLVARVFPPGTFTDLSGAAVDATLFGEILVSALPSLVAHMSRLVAGGSAAAAGGAGRGKRGAGGVDSSSSSVIVRDPRPALEMLTSVVLKWFVVAFSSSFPPSFADRVWDSLLFEGGKTLLRTALALTRLAAPRVLAAKTLPDALAVFDKLPEWCRHSRVHDALFDTWEWPPRHAEQTPRMTATMMLSPGVGVGAGMGMGRLPSSSSSPSSSAITPGTAPRRSPLGNGQRRIVSHTPTTPQIQKRRGEVGKRSGSSRAISSASGAGSVAGISPASPEEASFAAAMSPTERRIMRQRASAARRGRGLAPVTSTTLSLRSDRREVGHGMSGAALSWLLSGTDMEEEEEEQAEVQLEQQRYQQRQQQQREIVNRSRVAAAAGTPLPPAQQGVAGRKRNEGDETNLPALEEDKERPTRTNSKNSLKSRTTEHSVIDEEADEGTEGTGSAAAADEEVGEGEGEGEEDEAGEGEEQEEDADEAGDEEEYADDAEEEEEEGVDQGDDAEALDGEEGVDEEEGDAVEGDEGEEEEDGEEEGHGDGLGLDVSAEANEASSMTATSMSKQAGMVVRGSSASVAATSATALSTFSRASALMPPFSSASTPVAPSFAGSAAGGSAGGSNARTANVRYGRRTGQRPSPSMSSSAGIENGGGGGMGGGGAASPPGGLSIGLSLGMGIASTGYSPSQTFLADAARVSGGASPPGSASAAAALSQRALLARGLLRDPSLASSSSPSLSSISLALVWRERTHISGAAVISRRTYLREDLRRQREEDAIRAAAEEAAYTAAEQRGERITSAQASAAATVAVAAAAAAASSSSGSVGAQASWAALSTGMPPWLVRRLKCADGERMPQMGDDDEMTVSPKEEEEEDGGSSGIGGGGDGAALNNMDAADDADGGVFISVVPIARRSGPTSSPSASISEVPLPLPLSLPDSSLPLPTGMGW